MRTVFRFQRGEPIGFALRLDEGDADGLELSALLKPARRWYMPRAFVEPVAELDITFVPATESEAAHWLLGLSAADAAPLGTGTFATDARLTLDGEPVGVTDPVWIVIDESVSG